MFHGLAVSQIDDFAFVDECVGDQTGHRSPDGAASGPEQGTLAAFDA
jgi:hypothetical protein